MKGLAVLALLAPGCSTCGGVPDRDPPPDAAPHVARLGDTRGLVHGDVTGEWQRFTPPGEKMSVEFPGKPEDNVWNFAPDAGGPTVTENLWAVSRPDFSLVLTFNVVVFPPDFIPKDVPLDDLLEKQARHGIALEPHEIVSYATQKIFAGDVPGLEVRVEAIGGVHIRGHVFLLGDRGYDVQASWKADADQPLADRFLGSFRVP